MIEKADKLRILARNFFNDNRADVVGEDGYANYDEALKEFNDNPPSDRFIDVAIESYIKQQDGKSLFVNDVGFLITLRNKDNFIEFVNVQTEYDARRIQERTPTILNADSDFRAVFKAGILAGIRLRDEELIEKLGEFDREKTQAAYKEIPIQFVGNATFDCFYENGARWQHEQFIKAIKGDWDEN